MYQFAGLLNRPETHDVVFTVLDEVASAGFCKTLLLGVSEVWSRRDGVLVVAQGSDKPKCVYVPRKQYNVVPGAPGASTKAL